MSVTRSELREKIMTILYQYEMYKRTQYDYKIEDVIKEMIIILIRIKSCALPFYVFNICIYFILRAGGDTLSTMIMDSGALWLGSVLVSTVLSVFFDIPFVLLYITVEFCDVLKLFVAVYFYKLGKWAKNMTIESGV